MLFGLKISQDVFQMCMDQITNRLPEIIVIHDDICIYGQIREEHDQHLLPLMKTATQNGLVFQSELCKIFSKTECFSSVRQAFTIRMIFSRSEPILCSVDKLLPVYNMASSGLWKMFSYIIL